MEKKKVIIWSIVGIVSILLITLGISYAFWVFNVTQTNKNIISSQCFKLFFQENSNSNISLLEGYPMSDEDGKALTPYTFSIQNNCNAKAKYVVRLEIENETTMNMQYIKSLLNTNEVKKLNELPETSSTLSNVSKSLVLEEMTINANETKNYELRLWIDGGVSSDNKEVMNKILKSKVTIEGNYDSNYTEMILNGTDPILKDNLIPVTISNDGTVKKADTTKEWYSYEKKNWANAVILEDETKTYKENETIPESNIESYFVWIPRYKYQIFDNGLYSGLTTEAYQEKSQEIKVVFESKKTVATKGTKKGDWLTHPAFTSFDTNGMWVGKFETGYKGATTTSEAQANVNDSAKVQIKPNVYSWRSIQVSNAHLNSYNYQRNLDSHMMKNTEWGAVAYLQHSKYGSMASVRINNNNVYLTGYSSTREPTCGYTEPNKYCNQFGTTSDITQSYNTSIGYLASTTGNINGIYDMSGGAREYVMGVMVIE